MSDEYKLLEDTLRDAFAGVVWSHKIQEKQSDIYAENFKIMTVINIVAVSLTSAGIVTLIFKDPLWLKFVSAILSFATIFITAYFKSFDLQKLIISHKNTANKLISIRDQYKILLAQTRLQSDSVENLLQKHSDLVNQTIAIYQDAPSTTDKAVSRAEEALKTQKDNTFSDDEIDLFLPNSLRSEKNER